MTKRIVFILAAGFISYNVSAQKDTDRVVWLSYLDKVARPVLSNLANDALKKNMPVELSAKADNAKSRKEVSFLEAFGRTLSGIGPWLNLEGGPEEEVAMRNQYRGWSLKAMANATDPDAKDYLKWDGGQPLVDASFLAFGLVRCPWLWQHLDASVQEHVITAFKTTRNTVPAYSNWILFSAMIEAFFVKYDVESDPVRIEFAIREFANHWYIGDGFFSDGMNFHMDYYNSIVIHPYLAAIVEIINKSNKKYQWLAPKLDTINKRYAEILERNINTDGSYPVIGRSIAYRCGVFHHLADIAYKKQLPASLKPAQIRSALTAIIRKTMSAPTTFNKDGWLSVGLYGSQPDLGEFYITTGSLYLCADVFLPLGLPGTDAFWSDPAVPWTSVKIWNGENVSADHALDFD